MDTSGSDHRTAPAWQRPTSACLTALGLVVLTLVVVGIATAIEQTAHPPPCFGIGFGCTPDALTSVFLIGMLVGAPTVGVAWLLTTIGWVLTRRRSDRLNRWSTWWPSVVLAGVLAVVVVLAVFTAG